MKKLSTASWILIGIGAFLLILVLWFVGSYNSLITLSESVDTAWAEIENQYQRRADLIPNLVNTVQGAANFEKETQTQVTALRTQAMGAKTAWDSAKNVDEKMAAAKQIESAISGFQGLNINVERYPQLKATENFLALQADLSGTENRVAVARKRYNDAVRVYNIKIKRIPTNIVANMFGYEKETYFEAEEGTEKVPEVSFE